MTKKILTILFLIAFWSCSFAFGTATNSGERAFSCNLPAPGNFHVVSIGTTHVDLAWNSVPGATGYLLRTFDSSGYLVSSMIVTDTFATVDGLQGGMEYYSLLSTQCESGEPGFGEPNVARVDFLVLIIDLIVQASGPGSVELEYFESCDWLPWGPLDDIHWFEIRDTFNQYAQYRVRWKSSTQILAEVGEVPGNTLNTDHVNETGTPPQTIGQQVHILYMGQVVCIVTFTEGDESVQICGTQLSDGFDFRLLTQRQPSGFPGDGRSDEGSGNYRDQFYIQNPFTEHLHILAPQQSEEMTSIHLFDLNGNLVREQSFKTGLEEYSLPAADLPAGFYFLRVETGGEVQTFKVVKSE